MQAARSISGVLAALVLWAVASGPAGAQADAPGDPPGDTLVLVLNIISTTHARPATGVVLARVAPGEAALVLVPAQFVSAGDENIVLDGGTDILRHGRPARTVARSAEAGLALLEVEGLERAGVALDANFSLRPEAESGERALQFAAWPAANALAEGAPVNRLETRLRKSAEGVVAAQPELPGVSGPLFNACGDLAALHLAGEQPRVVDAQDIAAFGQGAGFEFQVSPCGEVPGSTPPAPSETPVQPEPEGDEEGEILAETAMTDPDNRSTALQAPAVPAGLDARYIAGAALLALLLLAGWFLLRRRRAPHDHVALTGQDVGERPVRLVARFDSRGIAVIEHDGATLEFDVRDGHVRLCHAGDDTQAGCVAVAGTPLLPGERAYWPDGAELRLGESRLVASIEIHSARDGEDK